MRHISIPFKGVLLLDATCVAERNLAVNLQWPYDSAVNEKLISTHLSDLYHYNVGLQAHLLNGCSVQEGTL